MRTRRIRRPILTWAHGSDAGGRVAEAACKLGSYFVQTEPTGVINLIFEGIGGEMTLHLPRLEDAGEGMTLALADYRLRRATGVSLLNNVVAQ